MPPVPPHRPLNWSISSPARFSTPPPYRTACSLVGRVSSAIPVRGVIQSVVPFEQRPHLGFPEPPVSTRGSDAADPAGRGPTRHRLRINAEQGSNLTGRQQTLSRLHRPPFTLGGSPGSRTPMLRSRKRESSWDVRPLQHR